MSTLPPPPLPPPLPPTAPPPYLPPPPPVASTKGPDPEVLASTGDVVIVGIAAVLMDLALHHGVPGAATTAALLLVAGWQAATATPRSARVAAVAAALFAGLLSLRVSPWLVAPNLVAAVGCLGFAAVLQRTGSARWAAFTDLFAWPLSTLRELPWVPAFLARPVAEPLRGERAHLRAIFQGLALATPILLVLGLLLASGDAVFASLFSIEVDLGGIGGHLAGMAASVFVFGAILLRSHTAGPVQASGLARPIGPTEAGVVLGAIAALYGTYVVTQLVVLSGGAQHILETADLTRAEYARAGFFQLLWAAGLTLVVLLGLRSVTVRTRGPARARLTTLSLSVILLTLGLVISSLVRLALYNDAFGLTMLRLFSMVFAGWVGLVLVLVGADFVASGLRGWLPLAVAASGLLVLAAVDLWNPEAFVARHNLTTTTEVGVDYRYLDTLTTDATPAFAAFADRSPVVRTLACRPDPNRSIWSANHSRWNAARTRDQLGCPAGS